MRARSPMRSTIAATLAAITLLVSSTGAFPAAGRSPTALGDAAALVGAASWAAIRVDQLGYIPNETKIAYLLATEPVPGLGFRVVDAAGKVVLRGTAGRSRGAWSDSYQAVHPLDITQLREPGTYRIRISGPPHAVSPPFRVGSREDLFGPRVLDAVAFFQAQRDGGNVIPGPLHRKPSHLNDRAASVFDWPTYEDPDSDVIVGDSLTKIDDPVDLAGGWFDAGDFIKFTHTTAYADGLMFAAMRGLGGRAPASLGAEARFGLRWLDRAWDPTRGIIYIQIGIGSGNQDGTFNGDHDLWRLPEKDDALTGSENRYLRSRPAFRGNDPGDPIPPNLAGRVGAAFALAAQVDSRTDPALARRELAEAAQVFAAAKTVDVQESDVVTALPHAFYPESSWRDDMEWAAAELALAGRALHDPRAGTWLQLGTMWAKRYLEHEAGDDTFNLYDTSALAHADLVRAIRAAGHPSGLALGESSLLDDLRAQLGRGVVRAAGDPFRSGVIYDGFDAAPHTFGHIVTAQLYHALTGDGTYDEFGTEQRDWALGANAWGASLMIGVGTKFPHCPQHVVANLSGSVDGSAPYLRGAVVNGPNSRSLFSDGLGGFFSEGVKCPADRVDRYARFSARGSRFVDDVRAWQTVEPAIDFTGAAILAFALLD
jgi:endoglucanase